MDKMKNLVVGLTGQTGAGKTTVSDYLKENGVTIIDTPGLNDDEAMTNVTLSVLPQIDAAIMVMMAGSPFSQYECDFLENKVITSDLGRVLFVVTGIDLYDEDDATANLAVTSVTELYASIFDWLKAHDVNAAVIIVIMLVVAFFNMTSALLILVLERTRMIGLLKAFGMRNGQLRQVFLWRASFITLRGLAWGNAVGLGLCFVQRYFHVVRLSSEGYLLSEVPISLGWGWWLALNAGAVAAIVALLVVPTYIVSTVKPDESIRYE